jgi:hypothetical protein
MATAPEHEPAIVRATLRVVLGGGEALAASPQPRR